MEKRDPTGTIDGDTVTAMNGDEEVHGHAMVGGSQVTYGKVHKKSHAQHSQKGSDEGDDEDDEEVVRGNRAASDGDLSKRH